MARACYSSADIYLLDDPLSALDANVGKHIFDRVIGPNGMLKDKTRVLVTHRISVLSKCDHIIVMKNGTISESGSYRQLLKDGGDFADFMLTHLNEEEDIEEEDLKLINQSVKSGSIERQRSRTNTTDSLVERKRSATNDSKASASAAADQKADNEKKKKKSGRLVEAETSETGSVAWTVYWEYFTRVGLIWCCAVLLSNVGSSSFNIAASQWLSLWSDDANNPQLVNDIEWRNTRLAVYGVLGSMEAVFLLVSTIALSLATLRGARILHNDMLHHLLRAPMSFFDTTPMGRILNRFARDIDVCDTTLSMHIRMTLIQAFRAVTALVVMAVETPLVLVVIIPIGLIYIFIQRLYIPSSRQLRRIESTTRSPIYIHFSETLTGSSSIRAFGSVDRFIDESNQRVDTNNMSSFATIITGRWLSVRLEFLGYTIIFANALYAVLSRRTLSPGVAGLTLSYAMTITRTLNNLVRNTTQLETNIVSVERCLEYTQTPVEVSADHFSDGNVSHHLFTLR